MKKIVTIILCVTMIMSTLTVNAGGGDANDYAQIIAALNSIENVKDKMGLAGIDFDDIMISDSIIAYEYTDDGMAVNSEFIPLFDNEILIGWIIKVDDGDVIYQFSTALINEVNEILDDDMSFAIIYDYDSTYLYDGTEIYALKEFSEPVEHRGKIEQSTDLSDYNLVLRNFENIYDLHYTSSQVMPRTPIYYECGVDFVSQNPPSNICWAASVACIVNYVKGTSYTAVEVAKRWYPDNYDQTIKLGDQDDLLRRYRVYYSYKDEAPSAGTILHNIQNGYPVYATFKWSNGQKVGGHDAVIYGINIIGGYLYVMDPEFGFSSTTYTASVGHRYVSAYSGVTLTLCKAACREWTP